MTDSDGASDSKSITITAANVAPRATINLPTPPREGANTIRFTSLLDSPADLASGLLFSIDRGDDGLFEVVDSIQSNVDLVLPDQGQYVLRLRVKDKDGASRDYSRIVTAENAPPTAIFELSSFGIINEGASGLSVRFVGATDPSTADFAAGFTYSYDLDGDGVFEIAGVSTSSQPVLFPQDGSYTIQGRIHDRDGGTTEYTVQVAVQNVAPQIDSFTGAATGNEGNAIAFTGSVVDPGSDVLTALARIRRTSVANDPGIEIPVLIAADRTFRFDPIFDADIVGGYDVVLVVNDGKISSQQSRHVTINNVSPTIDTQFNATIAAGRNLVRKLSFVDPGKDVWIVKADFGQGLAPIPFDSIKKNFVLDHAFATPGTFTVRAEVFDGISTTLNSFQVEVMPNSAPTVLHPISDKTVTQGLESVSSYVDLARVFVDSDGPVTELTYAVVSNSNAFLVATSIAAGRLNLSINPNNIGTATITVRATDVGGLSVDDTFTVTVLAAQSLRTRSVFPTNTGVQIEVDTVPDLSVLNLYDGVDASLDLADVTLIGANSGSVRGSLLWNASTNTIEFVKTGGHLVADTYTLTLFSRVDGWKTAAGALLDGDNNGIPGGDLVRTFTVAPTTARIVSIPDFSRGATSYASVGGVDAALDSGKVLVPSGTTSQPTTFANVINYSRGLNGLVFDVAGLVASFLTIDDFTFRIGNTSSPKGWAVAPTPTLISVTPGTPTTPARIRLEWADNAIQNTWLQIIVKANANTGLSQRVASYIGHALGEVNGTGNPLRVSNADLLLVQSAISASIVPVTDNRDVNKDRRVTNADLLLVQGRISATGVISMIPIPIAGSTSEG